MTEPKHLGSPEYATETGTITAPLSALVASAVQAYAALILRAGIPAPTTIDTWRHQLSFDQLMRIADLGELTVTVQTTTGFQVAKHVYATHEQSGVQITCYFACAEPLTDERRAIIDAHNLQIEALRDPCSAGCSDPDAHAEGAHDI